MNTFFVITAFALGGCVLGGISTRDDDRSSNALLVEGSSVSRCQGDTDRTLLLTSSDAGGSYTAEIVAADGQRVSAVVSGGGGMLGVAWPDALAAGTYGVVVRRVSDGSEALLEGVITLKAGPRLSSVSQGALSCRAAPLDNASVVVSGANLAASTVQLVAAASVIDVSSLASADGGALTLTVPASAADGAYRIVVHGAAGCDASLDGLTLGSVPPAFSLATVTPHLSTGSVPAYATVRMRLAGTSLPAAAQVFLGTAQAATVNATGSGLDVTFAQGTLQTNAASTPLRVEVSGCSRQIDFATPLTGAPAGLGVQASEPSALDAVTGFIVDVRGSFAITPDEVSSTQDVVLSFDADTDPFVEDWRPLTFFYGFGPKNASDLERLRFALPSVPAFASSYSAPIRISAAGAERFVESFFHFRATAAAAAAPVARTLHKSRDWLHAGSANEHFDVWGCHLDGASVSFQLVSETSGAIIPLTRTFSSGGARQQE